MSVALEIVGYSMVAVILWLMGGLMEWAGIGPRRPKAGA